LRSPDRASLPHRIETRTELEPFAVASAWDESVGSVVVLDQPRVVAAVAVAAALTIACAVARAAA
jgi:hypothetical protein